MRYWQKRLKKIIKEKMLADWRYKLAALAAAMVVWIYVVGQQSMQAVFRVPVYFQNLPANTEMVSQKLETVQVTIAGRRDRILSLKERQVWVSIDLTGMHAGRNRYKISRNDVVVPAGIEVKDFTPKKIRIILKTVRKEETSESAIN